MSKQAKRFRPAKPRFMRDAITAREFSAEVTRYTRNAR
ncbi:hypothetical protein FHT44_005097 [Mycolicibacterium sp. BK634]|nr:hypothetical protein [Mycolicibacterium sp. BK634]